MIKLDIIVVGALSVNCYLLWNSDSRECYIVDPGADAAEIKRKVEKLELKPKSILLTHAHIDHIQAVPELAQYWNIPVWIHPEDKKLYQSPENALLPWIPPAENLPEPVIEFPTIDGINIQILHTPGHTKGGVCFYLPEQKFALTGDTIFKGTHGRTDFPGGSHREIMNSIHNIIFKLPEETRIYPGHHGYSNIKDEKNNKFFF